MKVYFFQKNFELSAVANRMTLEGDEVVDSPRDADFCITREMVPLSSQSKYPPIVGGRLELHQHLGMFFSEEDTAPSASREDFFTAKWWNGGWDQQAHIVIPIRGLMNDNLGHPGVSSTSSRYIRSANVNALYESPQLMELLTDMRYTGWVTIGFIQTPGHALVCDVSLGMPYYADLSILEGIRTKLSDYYTQSSQFPLMESWTTGVHLSRYPWPFSASDPSANLIGLNKEVQKHFWGFDLQGFRNSVYTESTMLGVATAFSQELGESVWRALRTCRTIQCEMKQFRTDLKTATVKQWAEIQEGGFLIN